MERMKASDFPQELLDLFHLYVHGDIDRRSFLEGAGQHGFIDGFQQSGSEIAVDPNRGVDDGFGDVVEVSQRSSSALMFSAVSAAPRDRVTIRPSQRATNIVRLLLGSPQLTGGRATNGRRLRGP